MRQILLVCLVALVLGLAVVPGVSADPTDPPNPSCDTDDTTCRYGTLKRAIQELDPRNWPCPCDPGPR